MLPAGPAEGFAAIAFTGSAWSRSIRLVLAPGTSAACCSPTMVARVSAFSVAAGGVQDRSDGMKRFDSEWAGRHRVG